MFRVKIDRILFSFVLAALMLITSNSLMAQDTSSSPSPEKSEYGNMDNGGSGVASLAQDLQSKLNLTQDQTDSVKSILTDYQSSMSSKQMSGMTDGVKDANSRIEALLNNTQKSTWATVKSDWWAKVKKTLSAH